MKFPSTPEIKRVIAAVKNSGVDIGSVTISTDGIIISTTAVANSPELTPYEKWKATDDAKRGA